MAKAPAYKLGEVTQCQKCSYRNYSTQYCKGATKRIKVMRGISESYQTVPICPEEVIGEHMHLVCSNCGFMQIRSLPSDNEDI